MLINLKKKSREKQHKLLRGEKKRIQQGPIGGNKKQNHFVVVVQSLSRVCLCDSMDCSTPGSSVLHCLLEFTQTHDPRVSDAIQPCHALLPSFPAFNLSQHQGLFQ